MPTVFSRVLQIIIEDVIGYKTTFADFTSTNTVPGNIGISDFEPMGKDPENDCKDTGIGGKNKAHVVPPPPPPAPPAAPVIMENKEFLQLLKGVWGVSLYSVESVLVGLTFSLIKK